MFDELKLFLPVQWCIKFWKKAKKMTGIFKGGAKIFCAAFGGVF